MWSQSYAADLRKFTKDHQKMKCYGLGLGLDSFRMIALMANFRRLDVTTLLSAFMRSACSPSTVFLPDSLARL